MLEELNNAGLSPSQKTSFYAPGTVVRVTQQIPRRLDTYTAVVEGTVVRQERQGSGSWFARNKKNKVWLDRLVIQKADGEVSILNLDEYTRVEVVSGAQPTAATAPLILPTEDASAGIT
jgi:hypothetical protein